MMDRALAETRVCIRHHKQSPPSRKTKLSFLKRIVQLSINPIENENRYTAYFAENEATDVQFYTRLIHLCALQVSFLFVYFSTNVSQLHNR
jgi:hypothetical protein